MAGENREEIGREEDRIGPALQSGQGRRHEYEALRPARRGEGALYRPSAHGRRFRHFVVQEPSQGTAGDDEAAASRQLRQGRAHRIPAQPGYPRLDRGFAAGRQRR